LVVKAHKDGWGFTSGLFLILLDEEGVVQDTLYSADFEELLRRLDGFLVVGISIQEKDSGYDDQYFYGRLSADLKDLKIKLLGADVFIDAADLIPGS